MGACFAVFKRQIKKPPNECVGILSHLLICAHSSSDVDLETHVLMRGSVRISCPTNLSPDRKKQRGGPEHRPRPIGIDFPGAVVAAPVFFKVTLQIYGM